MYSYGSGFFFYLFFYSIAEYVDIDFFLELYNGPWLLSWSRGEMTERMLFPSVPSEETVCCLTVPVV